MAGVDNHAALAQALEPGAQQRRGLHVRGEDSSGAADEGFDAQSVNPLAQRLAVEAFEQCGDLAAARAIAGDERFARFRVSDVHPADAGQEELAAHRGHAVVHVHAHPGGAEHLRSHQASGAATDDHGGTGGEGVAVGHLA
ncbi:hypothetical protein D9M70_550940 [compost metagenome]